MKNSRIGQNDNFVQPLWEKHTKVIHDPVKVKVFVSEEENICSENKIHVRLLQTIKPTDKTNVVP